MTQTKPASPKKSSVAGIVFDLVVSAALIVVGFGLITEPEAWFDSSRTPTGWGSKGFHWLTRTIGARPAGLLLLGLGAGWFILMLRKLRKRSDDRIQSADSFPCLGCT